MKSRITFGGTSSYEGFEVFNSKGIVIRTTNFRETIGDKVFRTREFLKIRIWKKNKNIWRAIFLAFILTVLAFFLIGCFSSSDAFLLASFDLIGVFFVGGLLMIIFDMLVTLIRLTEFRHCPGGHRRFNCPECNKDLFEWHACEHKLIHVLESGQEVTIQAIMETPSYDEHCGCPTEEIQRSRLREPSMEKILETVATGKRYLALATNKN